MKSNDSKFFELFNENVTHKYFSPGRINLIGEHIDYNGGKVLPFAISLGTYGYVSLRSDNNVCVYSINFDDGVHSFKLDDFHKNNHWTDYIKGVIKMVSDKYSINQGFNLLISADLPSGASLSSSASLELLIGVILVDINGLNIEKEQLAVLCQKAENEFVNVNCGIMDQFIIATGKKDTAILLDTVTLNYSYIDLDLNNYVVMIMNTNVKRSLSNSKYNERTSECRQALEIIRKSFNVDNLSCISSSQFKEIENSLPNNLFKRVKHVLSENNRVNEVISALNNGNLQEVGMLLNESHFSLSQDYEVGCYELDTITELARECQGVLGSRQIGAGFGGCAIALIEEGMVENAEKYIYKNYFQKTAIKPSFYIAKIADGARKI